MTETRDIPQNEMDLNFHTDIPVGEILRRTRRHYNQSLEDIEYNLRIRASQLEAIENNEIEKLPGRVYAIGFVRAYSEYLGLDGDKMVHLFKEQSVGRKTAKPEVPFSVPASESKVPNLAVIGSSIFGVIVLIGFISFLMFPEGEPEEIPSVPDQLTKSQLNEAPSLVQSTSTPAATGTPSVSAEVDAALSGETPTTQTASNRIVLEITDASWIEIRNAQGAAILRQVLKAGDVYMVPNETGLVMATGNAGGIVVKVDGKPLPALGPAAAVRRNISLDPSSLLSRSPQ